MPVISVRIPQLGEGLQEALLVRFLREPGDQVKRDEPIYEMETDKATTEVECPYDGTLVEWTAEPGSVLEIGHEVAKMEVAEGVKEMPAGHGPAEETQGEPAPETAAAPKPNSAESTAEEKTSDRPKVAIPPRTRKYLKDKGLLDVSHLIPVSGKKMMPEDVDRYIEHGGSGDIQKVEVPQDDPFEESQLSQSQLKLNYRLVRGSQACVPVTLMTEVSWQKIYDARQQVKANGGSETGFSMMLWCVAETLKDHAKFRSSLAADGKTLRTFNHVNLGIAVALAGDALLTAVVKKADTMNRSEFFGAVSAQVEKARDGNDQADAATTISISNIGIAGMRWGIPAIVSPAVATLAVGEIFDHPVPDGDSFKFEKRAQLTLSFDHRVINGIGAAEFMSSVRKSIEEFTI